MPNTKNNPKKAFTLVELIVVIVILAILATIAFLSFSSQSTGARDSTRLADMTDISKGLALFNIVAGVYPKPDNFIILTASGIPIGYQGYAGTSVLGAIKMSNGGKDPLDTTYYTYSVNSNRTKSQILGYLEDGSNIALTYIPFKGNEANADPSSYSGRYILTKGDAVGVLLNSGSLTPVQSNIAPNTSLEIANTNTSYTVQTASKTSATGTGGTVFSYYYNNNADFLKNPSFASGDSYLQGYWDMETTVMSGSQVFLKDLSGKGNNGTCYNTGTIVDCVTPGSGPQFVSGNGTTGKAMQFDPDGRQDRILSGGSGTYDNFTMIGKIYLAKVGTGDLNHSSLAGGGPLCDSGTSMEFLVGGEYNVDDMDYQIGMGRCGQYSTDYFWDKTFKAGTWAVIGLVYEKGKRVTYFMNGESNTSLSSYLVSMPDVNMKLPLYIGGRRKNYGSIDEIKIYSRALSDSEMYAVYSAMK